MSSPSCTSPLFIPLVSPANSLSPANSHGRVSVSPGGLSIASSQSSPCDATIHPAGSPPIPSLTGSLSPDHRLPNLEHASSDAPAHHPNPEAGSQKRGYHVIYDVENGTGFRPITPEPESMQPTAANDTAKDVSESDAIGSAEVLLKSIKKCCKDTQNEIAKLRAAGNQEEANELQRMLDKLEAVGDEVADSKATVGDGDDEAMIGGIAIGAAAVIGVTVAIIATGGTAAPVAALLLVA